VETPTEGGKAKEERHVTVLNNSEMKQADYVKTVQYVLQVHQPFYGILQFYVRTHRNRSKLC